MKILLFDAMLELLAVAFNKLNGISPMDYFLQKKTCMWLKNSRKKKVGFMKNGFIRGIN
ncbi:hypothetical protein AsAng_0000870 [Aureispira anguillae]|uniref:Uncharacterized protein n=1 Tax=Aureispira anguillae TaxID=2864201 RepID=A0A915Y9T7_9BACT|nr:hypothetical protein AsAng_0000870 [Aureispira anguillae]